MRKSILSSGNYCGNIFRNRKEVDNHIFEACKPISSKCTSKDEVKNYNGNIVVEKEELIMKKCVENQEILSEKKNMIIDRPYYESEKFKNMNN